MKKLLNRIKYWFQVRRYHIDGVRVERDTDGRVNIYAEHGGKRHKLTGMPGACDVDGITDYGIYKVIKNSTGITYK